MVSDRVRLKFRVRVRAEFRVRAQIKVRIRCEFMNNVWIWVRMRAKIVFILRVMFGVSFRILLLMSWFMLEVDLGLVLDLVRVCFEVRI